MISEAQETVQDSDQMIYQFSFMWLQQCLMIYHFRNHNGTEEAIRFFKQPKDFGREDKGEMEPANTRVIS